MTQRDVQRETTRRRIAGIAASVLTEGGGTPPTTVAVQRAAGISRGTLLHHFPTRELLLVAAVAALREGNAIAVREALATTDASDPVARAVQALAAAFLRPEMSAEYGLWAAARVDNDLRVALQGWCIAGGTNIVFNAHLIIAAESARFGYPPSRVWGVPEAPWNWVARMGIQNARRYMLTGDEFTSQQALEMGAVLEVVPDDQLAERAMALAQRIALVPSNQLEMITLSLNAVANHQYDPPASRLLGTVFDGVARHSQEGADFVQRSTEVGFREAVRERDRPFQDYGERPQPD